jgi:hypothetical protein
VSEATELCPSTANVCVSACETDADCDSQSLCLCEPYVKATGATVSVGTCVPSDCRTDSDCGQDYLCAATPGGAIYSVCGRPNVFACQSNQDQCGGRNDCYPGESCIYQDGSYVCTF